MTWLKWILTRIRQRLWLSVTLYALAGVASALLAALVGRTFAGLAPFDIGAQAIDSLLTIIASSMLAVTTFSVGALTSAYASASASATPRATSLLTEDAVVQHALSTFVGAFLFSIVGLIALKVGVYGPEGRAVLFAVTLVLILLIVVALLRWIDRLTQLGRVADTIGRVEAAAERAMRDWEARPFLGARCLDEPRPGRPVDALGVGYVQFIDTRELQTVAADAGIEIDVVILPGAFVYRGSVLATVASPDGRVSDETVAAARKAFKVETQRALEQDPRFGLVVLSEIALRALSPAVNDPGTAIDVIGRQARLISLWAEVCEEGARDPAECSRVRVPPVQCADMLEDAYNTIGRDGSGQIDVVLRLVKALGALTQTGPEVVRSAAAEQLRIAIDRAEASLHNLDDLRRLRAAVDAASAAHHPA